MVAAAALVCCGCQPDNKFDNAPSQEEQGEGGAQPREFTVESYEALPTEVKELSSLCFNQSGDGFYAVGDEGAVYEIGLNGDTKKVLFNKGNHDWEGVERHSSGILLMDETESVLYRLSSGNLSRVADIPIPGGGASGKGPEGIMCVGDVVYVGNQAQPTRIVKYDIAEGKTVGQLDIKFVKKYISDLCYDPVDNTMWVIDSKGPAFYHCTLEGVLLATYNIPFVDQAEALVIDHTAGIAWVGCDTSSKLYKIPIEI